jgi:dihydrofolate reductase
VISERRRTVDGCRHVELPWPNSVPVSGDVPARIASRRKTPGGNLIVMGSSELIHSLQPRGLVDEYLLFIDPVVLGSGRRLFGHANDAQRLRLVDSRTSPAGVMTTTYQPS